MKRVAAASLIVLAVASFSPPCPAQVSGADKASAEALFNEGVALIASGAYAEGCRKLEGSQAVEATLGAELRLADCYEKSGKTASAWATFKHAQNWARQSGQGEREELARQRVEALAPKLTYLTLSLEGEAPLGLSVTRNGSALPPASFGLALPVDPGEQRIEASAPDHESWSRTLRVAPSPGKLTLSIPNLTKRVVRAAPPAAPATKREEAGATQRTAGVVMGGAGALAVLLGAGFGIYAKVEGDRSKRDQFCPTDNHNGCTGEGVELRDRARAFGTASTVTFVVGGALLATGVTLWATSGPSDSNAQTARLELRAAALPGQLSTSLGGTW
jgi:hypothetical protein